MNYIDIKKYLNIILFHDNVNVVAGIWLLFVHLFTFIEKREKKRKSGKIEKNKDIYLYINIIDILL